MPPVSALPTAPRGALQSLACVVALLVALSAFGPRVALASCTVSAPANGALGNCTTTLPAGASCSFACLMGAPLDATPSATSCSTTNILTTQRCSGCLLGTFDNYLLQKMVGSGTNGAQQGISVSLSADGATLAVGGHYDNFQAGAVWIWTRSGAVWSQQGSKLVGSGAVGAYVNPVGAYVNQGRSVSLSADGATLAVGGSGDNSDVGAVWIWTRSGGVWSQQGSKLVGSGAVGTAQQGVSVSLSADGATLAVGGKNDNNYIGSVWIWTRNGATWSQQGGKLVGSGAVGQSIQGMSVSLSTGGGTLAVGGEYDNSGVGAAWIWTRSGAVWTQQGNKLVGNGTVGVARQGGSVSLSADANMLAVGGPYDNSNVGAVWIWTRSGGVWSQQGSKLIGSGAMGYGGQGTSLSLSADTNLLAVGAYSENSYAGAVWIWTRTGGVWSELRSKLVGGGAVGAAYLGMSVSLSANGSTLAAGGPSDEYSMGAAWVDSRIGMCKPCPSGYFCPGSDSVYPCSLGSWCPTTGNFMDAACPQGSYCPFPTQRVLCAAGFYNRLLRQSASSACLGCAQGAYCPTGSVTPAVCAAGAYCSDPTNQLLCPAGTFNSLTGRTSLSDCTACASGAYCPIGSLLPVPCAMGSFCASAAEQVRCPAGRWSNSTGLSAVGQCRACSAGRYSDLLGQTSAVVCLACSMGTACPAGSGSPISCAAGSFSLAEASACTACPVGTWQGQTEQSECVACTPGTSNALLGKKFPSDCVFCTPGKFQSEYGARNCSQCDSGKYTNLPGSSSCAECSAGTFQDRSGQSGCRPCPENHYLSTSGATQPGDCRACPDTAPLAPLGSINQLQCVAPLCSGGNYTAPGRLPCQARCPPGRYCIDGQLIDCPVGTSQELEGQLDATACRQCEPGEFTSLQGSATCTPCAPGSWQPGYGSATCVLCAVNEWSDAVGATTDTCQSCPPATPNSPRGSSSELQCTLARCSSGLYSRAGEVICQAECPLGSWCVGGVKRPCAAGSYADKLRSSVCTACGAGRFGAGVGAADAVACSNCPMATYSELDISGACTLCSAGNVTAAPGSTSAAQCVPLSGCGSAASPDTLCALGLDRAVPLSALLPSGRDMLGAMQEAQSLQTANGSASDGSQANLGYTVTASRSAASLRAAAFGGTEAPAGSGRGSLTAVDTRSHAVSVLLTVALICGLCLAGLSLLLYRLFPARVTLLLDQFSWRHPAPVDGSLQRKPTQLGAAFTLAFACSAVLLAMYLGTAPNVQRSTSLVPPSASVQAGSAAADVQITVRAFIGAAAMSSGFCPPAAGTGSSPLLGSADGFNRAVRIRSASSVQDGACAVAVDCSGCTLLGAASQVSLRLPYSAQLIEFEVRVTGAAPASASTFYGVVSQQPGRLLDAQGQLGFSVTESFYADSTLDPVRRGSGYELDFQAYSTVQVQPSDSFSSASVVELAFLFSKSPVVFETSQSSRLSILQILSVVLSAVMSLLGVFGILFALTLRYVLPAVRAVAGHVVDERDAGGKLGIREDTPQSNATKYQTEEERNSAEDPAAPWQASTLHAVGISSRKGAVVPVPDEQGLELAAVVPAGRRIGNSTLLNRGSAQSDADGAAL